VCGLTGTRGYMLVCGFTDCGAFNGFIVRMLKFLCDFHHGDMGVGQLDVIVLYIWGCGCFVVEETNNHYQTRSVINSDI